MSLRIAFDMDGVLANMDAGVDRVAQTLVAELPENVGDGVGGDSPSDPGTSRDATAADNDLAARLERIQLSARQQRQLAERVRSIENFWETLEEIEPGAVSQLAKLATERRWEVIFLTKRPATAGDTPQLQTQRWLQRCGFAMPSVFVVSGSRGQVASALSLDFVVDDRPENCLDVVLESRAKAILVSRDTGTELPAKARRLGIGVVSSVAECLDILGRGGDLPHKPGMITRIKRLLRIETESFGL